MYFSHAMITSSTICAGIHYCCHSRATTTWTCHVTVISTPSSACLRSFQRPLLHAYHVCRQGQRLFTLLLSLHAPAGETIPLSYSLVSKSWIPAPLTLAPHTPSLMSSACSGMQDCLSPLSSSEDSTHFLKDRIRSEPQVHSTVRQRFC